MPATSRPSKTPYWNQSVRDERPGHGLAPTMTNQRGLKGTTLGPANGGRRLSAAERAAVVEQMRKEGKI